MNKRYVLFNLKEAHESLGKLIQEMEADPEYERGNFIVDIGHIYHHLNHAWNAQDVDPIKTDKISDEDFKKWNEFPSEVMLMWGSGS